MNIKEKFGSFSLTSKFLISSIIIIFITLIIINIFIYMDFKKFFIATDRRSFEKRFKKSITSATSFYVFRNDWHESMDFSPIMNILEKEPDLIEVLIFSPKGKLLSSKHSKNIFHTHEAEFSEGLKNAINGKISYHIENIENLKKFHDLPVPKHVKYVQEIYYPVIFNGKVRGVIEIYKDFTEVFNNINSVRIRATSFSAFGFMIYVFLLYFIVQKIDKKEKILKEKIKYYEKLSILGQFASKMAHEIGTPMHVIMGNIDLIQDEYEDEFIKKCGENISRQINKIQNIIRNYLYVSKKPEPSYERVNLKNLINDIITDMSFTISENIELKHETPDINIFTDRSFIEQILYNFIKNSADSIGENKGIIEVKSKIDNNFLTIEVIDNGKGIDEKLKDKIFDPFFSTKKTGKGTGLGLAVCKELVEALNGSIFCDTKNGKTIFGIKIPVKGDYA